MFGNGNWMGAGMWIFWIVLIVIVVLLARVFARGGTSVPWVGPVSSLIL